MEKIEISICDDHDRFRKAIIDELSDYNIISINESCNGQECIEQLKKKLPEVLLLDLEMPIMDGNSTLSYIKENIPSLKVLILSAYDDKRIMENYIYRGANGYLPKEFISSDVSILVEGIKEIKNNKTFFYSYNPKGALKFTKRETDIIPLLYDCKTSKEIANVLGLEEKNVNKLRSQLHKKTNSRNATEFIKYCIERGLQFLGKK
jgi:DNA-binding NarL/FixJ family response regulator